jgi:hypothetical protein
MFAAVEILGFSASANQVIRGNPAGFRPKNVVRACQS